MMKAAAFALVLVLASCQMPLRNSAAAPAEPPGGWFHLVMELQAQEDQLDKTDRRFVNYMANYLSVTDIEIKPTAKQRRWLLDIKRRLDARQ